MAEIDYAFLADFAKVEPHGVLTVVGASWTFIEAPQFPIGWRLAVACRVRGTVSEGPVPFVVTFNGPVGADQRVSISTEGALVVGDHVRPYGPDSDRVGHLLAMDLQVPLPEPGLYEVIVELPESGERRRIAFEAMQIAAG